jgi:arginase
VRAATEVRRRAHVALAEDGRIVLLGGDCTVSIGLVAAAAETHDRLGLAYLDSQTDLNTPETTDTGILDSMGLAHLLGCTDNALAQLGGQAPLLFAERVIAFGYHPQRITEAEHAVLAAKPVGCYPATIVAGNAKAQARDALRALEANCDAFITHFDVDIIDFAAFPVADAPVYRGFGLSFGDAFDALTIFLRSPKCIALSVTEFNPDRDRSRDHGRRFVAALADALAAE